MGLGDGSLGALVSWAGLVLALNQFFLAAAFISRWRFKHRRIAVVISLSALSYFLQAIAILIRGGSILAPTLLVLAIPVSILFGVFWSALFAENFFTIVRVRVACILGPISLALSYWLTAYVGPKVGYWKAWFGIADQFLFRTWSVFLVLFTIVQVFGIGSVFVKKFPVLKPRLKRKNSLVTFGLGLATVAIPTLLVFINPPYPVILLIFVCICYFVGWITLFLTYMFHRPTLSIGEKIGSILSYHAGITLGVLLILFFGAVFEK